MKPYLKSHLSIAVATVSRVPLAQWRLVAGGSFAFGVWDIVISVSRVCEGGCAAPGQGQGTDLALPCVTSSGETPQMKRFCEQSPEV